jgi:hypothetical protein
MCSRRNSTSDWSTILTRGPLIPCAVPYKLAKSQRNTATCIHWALSSEERESYWYTLFWMLGNWWLVVKLMTDMDGLAAGTNGWSASQLSI